jgi:hypothetical protein
MSIHPLVYAKSHPWATGIIVVIGGIIFLSVTGILGGHGGGSTATTTGPSAAELQANAAIQVAQIQAGAVAAQYGSQVQLAQIGAGVQTNADNLSAGVTNHQSDLTAGIYTHYIDQQTALANDLGAQQTALRNAALGAVSTKNINGETRGATIQAIITGQPVAPVYNGNTSNSASAILSSIFGSGGIGGAASGIASIFSDQSLKENIRYLGDDRHGLGVYEYNYKGSRTVRRGRIAQEVARKRPDLLHITPHQEYLKLKG